MGKIKIINSPSRLTKKLAKVIKKISSSDIFFLKEWSDYQFKLAFAISMSDADNKEYLLYLDLNDHIYWYIPELLYLKI